MSEMIEKLLLRMSEMEPLSVRWAWDGFVPMGRVSMITGAPGVGKSLLALQIAAMVTRGVTTRLDQTVPDQVVTEREEVQEAGLGEDWGNEGGSFPGVASDISRSGFRGGGSPRGVLVLSAADDLQDTVLPRLIAAGADPSLVFCLKGDVVDETGDEGSALNPIRATARSGSSPRPRVASEDAHQGAHLITKGSGVRPFLLSQDLSKVSSCITELSQQGIEVGLIVIDSIDRYIGPNENKSERIGMVAQLADLASRSKAAVLVTANSSMKSGSRGGTVVYQELFNVARSVLMVADDSEATERRRVELLKHNLTGRRDPVSFVVEDGAIGWEGGRLKISTVGCRNEARRTRVVCDDGEGDESLDREEDRDGAVDRFEPFTFWLPGEIENGGAAVQSVPSRTARESVLKKRDSKRRERKARRASQRRNRVR